MYGTRTQKCIIYIYMGVRWTRPILRSVPNVCFGLRFAWQPRAREMEKHITRAYSSARLCLSSRTAALSARYIFKRFIYARQPEKSRMYSLGERAPFCGLRIMYLFSWCYILGWISGWVRIKYRTPPTPCTIFCLLWLIGWQLFWNQEINFFSFIFFDSKGGMNKDEKVFIILIYYLR